MWVTREDGVLLFKQRSLLLIYLAIGVFVLINYLGYIPICRGLIAIILGLGFLASVFGEWGEQDEILHKPLIYLGFIVMIAGAFLIHQS